ncbi:MAG: hypothetical protein NVS3B25_26200 [Hymenobacter sp.]
MQWNTGSYTQKPAFVFRYGAALVEALAAVSAELRPALFRDGQWRADYKRLRIVAEKQ